LCRYGSGYVEHGDCDHVSKGRAMATGSTVNPRSGYAGWVAPLCWTAVALEGFDLVVLA
jgi:hypothetical protein